MDDDNMHTENAARTRPGLDPNSCRAAVTL
jgi:hypothetical protein